MLTCFAVEPPPWSTWSKLVRVVLTEHRFNRKTAESKLALRQKCDWPIPTWGWPSASYPVSQQIPLPRPFGVSQHLRGSVWQRP